MRISDWSSDVCSSDLNHEHLALTNTVRPHCPRQTPRLKNSTFTPLYGQISRCLPASSVLSPVTRTQTRFGHVWTRRLKRPSPTEQPESAAPKSPLSAKTSASSSVRSEEQPSELQSLMRTSSAV